MGHRLDDKVAVVTGGGAGIGEATCLRFAEAGASVVAVDRDREATEETATRIQRETEQTAIAIETDVGESAEVDEMTSVVNEQFDGIDILVNNAGIRVEPAPITETTSASWDEILDVNLRGVARCSKHLIPLMDDGGAIVNVASVGASKARPNWGQYDATKGAVVALTKDMAADVVEEDIRVNAVSPGWVITDYHLEDRTGDAATEYFEAKTTPGGADHGLMQRAGAPREIANAILFLASDEASFVTGTELHVDGGASITD